MIERTTKAVFPYVRPMIPFSCQIEWSTEYEEEYKKVMYMSEKRSVSIDVEVTANQKQTQHTRHTHQHTHTRKHEQIQREQSSLTSPT